MAENENVSRTHFVVQKGNKRKPTHLSCTEFMMGNGLERFKKNKILFVKTFHFINLLFCESIGMNFPINR